MLLAPQVHTGGRTGCAPSAFPDYREIKKQVNKMKRTDKGNIDNKKTWIGDSTCQGKQGEGRNEGGEKEGEVTVSSAWAGEAWRPETPAHGRKTATRAGKEG